MIPTWGIGGLGQDYADRWGLDRIGVQAASQTTRGAGQIVAVVDTGLDYTHPDKAHRRETRSSPPLRADADSRSVVMGAPSA